LFAILPLLLRKVGITVAVEVTCAHVSTQDDCILYSLLFVLFIKDIFIWMRILMMMMMILDASLMTRLK